jgi:hypothetical protein
MPSPRSLSPRELYLHSDPATVGAWCRAHAAPGAVIVAPSAAARRLALCELVARTEVTLGLTVVSPARFLAFLESRAGLPSPRMMSDALERILVTDAARAARIPLFDDDGDIAAHGTPAGAINAVTSLVRTLRMNRVSPEQFAEAGGDHRAAEAYRRFERRRRELGLHDETDRIDALLKAGVPSLPLVLEEPASPNRVRRDLYEAAIEAASTCHVGLSALSADDSTPIVAKRFEALGFVVHHAVAPTNVPSRAVGGVGTHDEVDLVAREMLALLRTRPDHRPSGILGAAPNKQ